MKQEIERIFRTVLEIVYEGIVVVDANGMIVELNDAYARFLGMRKEDALHRHVTEVIQNTRLHEVLKTGVAEKDQIQIIHGHEMLVHRIPMYKGDDVIGAVGMVMFQGVNEQYQMMDRIHQLAVASNRQKNAMQKTSDEFIQTFDAVIGHSSEMIALKKLALRVARTAMTVLITGESGTGKELFARAIHSASLFGKGPFVDINCAAIPENLLESELFGYEEGAFTGAKRGGKIGKFEAAHTGTLFLDELGDMPLAMQAKLLRVLEDRAIVRVGGIEKRPVNLRVIAATHRNLAEMVEKGKFREDLYFRLSMMHVQIPPLRYRKTDIPTLVHYYMDRLSTRFHVRKKRLHDRTLQLLYEYTWPGNIRELVNVVEVLVEIIEADIITPDDLPDFIYERLTQGDRDSSLAIKTTKSCSLKERVVHSEREIILGALKQTGGNKVAAARLLGIHRSTLYLKLKQLGLS
ncbi:sigma-54 interaction domain-containing protein [Sulfoacidibacillus thermotolerans]|nr:sigma 54-interacting transcriptional regulator [Sulfoacidibacillus thermotolerans]